MARKRVMSAFSEFKENFESGLEYFGLYYGKYEALVLDNDDPEKRGRLKVSCPRVYGKEKFDKWVYPSGLFSGKKYGFHAIPEKGDVIRLTFDGGDSNFPIWEYGWWLKNNAIEIADKGVFCFVTPKGHSWVIDEKNDSMYFSYKNGKVIEIKGQKISLGTKGGSNEKAALGDTLKAKLEAICDNQKDICTAITALTVTCAAPSSPSTVPVNAAIFQTYAQKASTIKGELSQILSQVVTLD